MISIDGVELNPSLNWVNRDTSHSVAQNLRITRGGNVRVYQQSLLAGRPIILEANEDSGWFTNDMRIQILERADRVGDTFIFHYFGEEHAVLFDHSNPPAVEFTRIVYRQVPDPDDRFMGLINLVTLS